MVVFLFSGLVIDMVLFFGIVFVVFFVFIDLCFGMEDGLLLFFVLFFGIFGVVEVLLWIFLVVGDFMVKILVVVVFLVLYCVVFSVF